jgi:hypothetical protein
MKSWYITGDVVDLLSSSLDVPCGTAGGGGFGGNDTCPQNLTEAIPATSAMPTTPTPMRNCPSVIDTDLTIHAASLHRHAQTVQRESVDWIGSVCA